jgi:predicted permease
MRIQWLGCTLIMNWRRKLQLRFRVLFQKQKLDAQMDDEMRSHIELQAQENIAGGMNPEEAHYAALRQFGWVESIKDTCREQRGVSWIENLGQDVRYGSRILRRNPGFATVAVLTLALGIGANTAIFTVINTLLLRSLPVKDPGELVSLSVVERDRPSYNFSFPLYEQFRDSSRNLSGIFAAGGSPKRRMIASGFGGTDTEFVRAQEVSGNFFSLLGVSAEIGRTFTAADDQAGNPQPVTVLSHAFWVRRFGADPSVVGKTIQFEDVPLTIVGITPPNFFGFQPGENPDLWWPMQMVPQVDRGFWGQRLKKDESSWLRLMGRVPAGVDRSQAQAQLDQIAQRHLAQGEPVTDRKIILQPGHAGYTRLRQQFRKPLLILMVAVGLVLLIACANVAGLLLARAAARQREFSVRSALGAGRLRLFRQLLAEGLLLAGLGSLLGLLVAQGGTRALLLLMDVQEHSVAFNIAPDARVLLFTIAASVVTGSIFGLAPALHSSRIDLASALNATAGGVAGNASGQRINQTLVIAQVALSLVLLIGAGLFVRTLEKLKGTDLGFNRENVMLFDLEFTQRLDTARGASLFKEVLARLETSPGVRSASLSSYYLASGGVWTEDVVPEGYVTRRGEDLSAHVLAVGPRFFETLGAPVLSGRDFGLQDERPDDSPGTNALRAAIINQAAARRYFADANPVGRHFQFREQPGPQHEIVGVVKDVRHLSLREPAGPTIYLFSVQQPSDLGLTFVLRTDAGAGAMTSAIRGIVREIDPTVQVRNPRAMDALVNEALHRERVLAQLGGFFSLFALALACLGIYGVLSLAVVQRTREIGVRVALGAQRHDVLWLVIGRGLKLVLIGSVIGLIGAFSATRLVSGMLYGVTPTDPVTFSIVALALIVVALLAAWLPARRASKVDPMVALRYE